MIDNTISIRVDVLDIEKGKVLVVINYQRILNPIDIWMRIVRVSISIVNFNDFLNSKTDYKEKDHFVNDIVNVLYKKV